MLDERLEYANIIKSQIGGRYDNVIYAHVSLMNQPLVIRGGPYNFTDVHFVNNVVKYVDYLDGTPIAGFYVNHTLEYGFFWGTYIKVYGENTIFAPVTNNTNFVDPSKIDYRLVPNSPGWRKGMYLQSVPADITGRAHDVTSRNIGAYGTNAGPIIFPIRNTSIDPSAFGPVSSASSSSGTTSPTRSPTTSSSSGSVPSTSSSSGTTSPTRPPTTSSSGTPSPTRAPTTSSPPGSTPSPTRSPTTSSLSGGTPPTHSPTTSSSTGKPSTSSPTTSSSSGTSNSSSPATTSTAGKPWNGL